MCTCCSVDRLARFVSLSSGLVRIAEPGNRGHTSGCTCLPSHSWLPGPPTCGTQSWTSVGCGCGCEPQVLKPQTLNTPFWHRANSDQQSSFYNVCSPLRLRLQGSALVCTVLVPGLFQEARNTANPRGFSFHISVLSCYLLDLATTPHFYLSTAQMQYEPTKDPET